MLVSPLEGHRIWSATYDDDPNPLLALGMRVLSDRLGPLQSSRVVDIACGTGRWMVAALAQGADVTGVDLCEEMLLAAARKPTLKGRLVLAPADSLPVADNAADLVLCSFAMSYFPSVFGAIQEMARITKRGGGVVVADLHPEAENAGWKRSFRASGEVYELEHHSYSDAPFAEAALELCWQADARFGPPEREIFQRAGKESLFAAASAVPAVRVTCWKKK